MEAETETEMSEEKKYDEKTKNLANFVKRQCLFLANTENLLEHLDAVADFILELEFLLDVARHNEGEDNE